MESPSELLRGGRRERGVAGRAFPPRNDPHSLASQLAACIEETRHLNAFLRHYLRREYEELDTFVYEHQTVQLAPGDTTKTITLQPEKSSNVLLTEGINVASSNDATLAPTAASVMLDTDIMDVLPLLVRGAGAQQSWMPYRNLLRPESARILTVVFPAVAASGLSLTFGIFGRAIPATIPDVLH